MGASRAGQMGAIEKIASGAGLAGAGGAKSSWNVGRSQRSRTMISAISIACSRFDPARRPPTMGGGLPAMGIPCSVFHRVGRTCAARAGLPARLQRAGQGALLGGQVRGIDLGHWRAFRAFE